MPCYDPRGREEDESAYKASAVLCGLLQELEKWPATKEYLLQAIKWRRVGVTEEWFRHWWQEHKRQDAKKTQ